MPTEEVWLYKSDYEKLSFLVDVYQKQEDAWFGERARYWFKKWFDDDSTNNLLRICGHRQGQVSSNLTR